jgi:hypothetical protein
MTVVVNEMEVIAPTQNQTGRNETNVSTEQPIRILTARDVYWVVRRLVSRQLRLKAD